MTDFVQLLKSHDDPRHAEQPPGFDRVAAESRFRKLAEEVLHAFSGSRFETGAEIQDASFHGSIEVAMGGRFARICASNFDRFIAFYGSDDDCLTPEARARLLAMFAAHGYTFIPIEVLAMPYDGANPGVTGFTTWGHRYFSWT